MIDKIAMYGTDWKTNLKTKAPTGTLLIFPAEMDSCQNFALYAEELGFNIVAASSSKPDLRDGLSNQPLHHLPFVNEKDFEKALSILISEQSISHIFTGHSGIWTTLKKIEQSLPRNKAFKLTSFDPFESTWRNHQSAYRTYSAHSLLNIAPYLPKVTEPSSQTSSKTCSKVKEESRQRSLHFKAQLPQTKMTALYNLFKKIPGQCDETKLQGLKEITRVAPKGDIIEVGVLYGRSAISLAWLSNYYNNGNVIAVDPWDLEDIEGQGQKAEALNELVPDINCEHIFNIFNMNAAQFNNIGHIKAPSSRAIKIYKKALREGFLQFNEECQVTITGNISILHIDGNHRYDMVKKDIELWTPFLISGGWLLLDDYLWQFGDGPKKIGDELLSKGQYDLSFCLGDTLYLRKS